MRVLDPGHNYELTAYDVPEEFNGRVWQPLQFMKRIGDGYPGNTGEPHAGTNCQEVLRALIDRVKYLEQQVHSVHNGDVIVHLRHALFAFEIRAAKRRGEEYFTAWRERVHNDRREKFSKMLNQDVEDIPTCPTCGHIFCAEDHDAKS